MNSYDQILIQAANPQEGPLTDNARRKLEMRLAIV